jgi:hypothetical protein
MSELVMNIDRMTRLGNLLERDAVNPKGVSFNLRSWASNPKKPVRQAFPLTGKPEIKVDCGTQACAFGLAAISGEFAADGLGYRIVPGDAWLINEYGMLQPTYEDLVEYDAAKAFFGLTSNEAMFLFDPWEYPAGLKTGALAELEVVKRINYLIGGGHPGSYGHVGDDGE